MGAARVREKITLTLINLQEVMTLTSYEYWPMHPAAFAPPAAIATPHHAEAWQLASG